jgi:defect-in-organelle-trafficking protein DotC
MRLSLTMTFIIAASLVGCSSHQQNLDNVNTTNINQLESVRVDSTPSGPSTSRTELSQLRGKALRDTAMSLGAQAGLASASEQINLRTARRRKDLETIYNFNALMLPHGVMPPVLEFGDNTLNLDSPNAIRVADRTYKIVAQARFATTAPNWREYLWLTFSKPPLPDRTLLPRSVEESKVWRSGIRAGWEKGQQQAYNIFQQNLARLKRDFRGMLLYRKLLEEKMISPPFVSRTELGITGDGDDMRVNDQVLRIVELPKLQTNSRHWNAVVVKRDE